MKGTKGIFLAAVTVLFLCACKSMGVKPEKIGLNGMVYDTSNRPVVNYTIFIDGKKECVTDIGGRFYIKSITRSVHDLKGEGEGYLSVSQKITVTDKSQVLYIRIPSVEEKLDEALGFLTRNDIEQAEKCIEEVLDSDGQNSDALFFKAALCLLKGNKEEADSLLEKLKEKGGSVRYEDELKKLFENQR